MLRRHTFALISTLGLAAALAFAGACGDDDDGDAAREDAADLSTRFEAFRTDMNATTNVESLTDELRDRLKDDCGAMQDEIDSDDLDDFCDDLANAIDDDNQTDFMAVKARFGSDVEAQLQDEIADRVREAGDDDDGLSGGSEDGDDGLSGGAEDDGDDDNN